MSGPSLSTARGAAGVAATTAWRPPALPRRWQLGALFALALVLRLHQIGGENFWLDEVYTVQLASQDLGEIVSNYRPDASPARRDQAPLGYLVTHFFVADDDLETMARLPSAICGAAAVAAAFYAASLFLPLPVALLAALFLALSPLHLWYSQEVRWYGQWSLWTTVSYAALLRAWQTERRGAWAAYFLSALLGLYTMIFSFLVIACQLLSAVLLRAAGRASAGFVRRVATAQTFVVLLSAPVIWMIFGNLGDATGTPRSLSLAVLPYTAFAYAVGFSLGPTLAELHGLPPAEQLVADHPAIVLVFAVFLPLLFLGVRRLRRQPAAAAILLPWLAGPAALMLIIALLTDVAYQVRYTLAALPAFFIVVALGAHALPGAWLRWAGGSAALGCLLLSTVNYFAEPRYDKEDVRGALAHIRSTSGSEIPVVAVGQIDEVVSYYGADLPLLPFADCWQGSGVEPPAGALWLVAGRDWEGRAPACLGHLSESRRVIERRVLSGVDLWLLAEPVDARRPAEAASG